MPYLVAKPQLAELVDYYDIELDGLVVRSDPEHDEEAKMVRLHHDLSGIATGDHSVRVRSVNRWGESGWSIPFDFTSASPPMPMELGIEDS